MPPGVVVVEPEPELLPPVVVLGGLPAEPVVPPLPTAPLELPPVPVLVPVLVLSLLPAEERCSRMHLSRSRPVRWSHRAVLGPTAPVELLLLVLGELLLVLGVLLAPPDVLVSLELEVEPLPALLLGVVSVALGDVVVVVVVVVLCSVVEVLGVLELLEVLGLVLVSVLGLVALGLLLLLLELPDVWAMDAPEIPSSAAATAT